MFKEIGHNFNWVGPFELGFRNIYFEAHIEQQSTVNGTNNSYWYYKTPRWRNESSFAVHWTSTSEASTMADKNPSSSPSPQSTANNSSSPPKKLSDSQITSLIKAYWIPATLFSLFMLFHLVFIPKAFPVSHYDGIHFLSPILFFVGYA